jgi:energy-coupling factor transporter ATP-binding protein EcfA2
LGTEQLNLIDGYLLPTTTNDIDLGSNTYRFNNFYPTTIYQSDSQIHYLGTANDATITFDGNSLNIVANVTTATDDLELTGRQIRIFGNLNVYDIEDLYSHSGDLRFDRKFSNQPHETTFVLFDGEHYFYVDTSGYDYCRYVLQIDGFDIISNPLEVKSRVGYLAEQNPLYDDMYVKEYLGFAASVYKIKNPVSRVKEMIDLTGLQIEQNKKIGQLSKGYRQRVGLAQAMIHNPSVLILDEPTSGLDPNQIIEIREVIRQLGEDKTILFSSHILQEPRHQGVS